MFLVLFLVYGRGQWTFAIALTLDIFLTFLGGVNSSKFTLSICEK